MEAADAEAANEGAPLDDPAYLWPKKGLRTLWKEYNLTSLDGLPGLQSALGTAPVTNARAEAPGELLEEDGQGRHVANRGGRWSTFLDTKFITGASVGFATAIMATRWLT